VEIYKNIQYFNELPSTNEFAINQIRNSNVPEFSVIVAHNQTKGKGQRGNEWLVTANLNATFSIVLYPNHVKASMQFIISECISLAVKNAIQKYVQNVKVKWPNDIYVGENKIAGILIENSLRGSIISSSVVGVGLNCNQIEFNKNIPNPTSLKLETGVEITVSDVLKGVLAEFYTLYRQSKEESNIIHEKYKSSMYNFLQESRYQDSSGEFSGTIVNVDETGCLYVEDLDGKTRSYQFKEIQFL